MTSKNSKIKVLNLYAGIGGNRKLWENVEVTAVEINPQIVEIYKYFFPEDKVIVGDAHKFLINNCEKYDFVWSSPPCPTHSVVNGYLNAQGCKRYPDMNLYQEIIYLDKFYKGKYCVENVMSYYRPLIKPRVLHRHYFWSNFYIKEDFEYNKFNTINARGNTRQSNDDNIKLLVELHNFDFSGFNKFELSKSLKSKVLRNCVNPDVGKYIFDCAFKVRQYNLELEYVET